MFRKKSSPDPVRDLAETKTQIDMEIRIEYNFHPSEVKKALDIVHKQTTYRKNLIKQFIVVLLLINYAMVFIRDSTNGFSLWMSILCLGLLFMIWYISWNHRKKIVKIINEQKINDNFILIVYQDGIKTLAQQQEYHYLFNQEISKAFETDELFIVIYHQTQLLVIPKRCCMEVSSQLSTLFSTKLRKNYKFIN